MSRTLLIAIVLITVLFLAGWTLQSKLARPQYEYETVTIKTYMFVSSGSPDIDRLLNDMGSAGWEMVGHDTERSGEASSLTRFYFKRLR
jgi:hypothetical protein